MSSRHGVTLMEVLVAIFIMGIGMLAMLVLFPLGVLRMADAIEKERLAQECRNATAIANFQGLRNDAWVLYDQSQPAQAQLIAAVIMTNPGAGYAAAPAVTFSPPQLAGGVTATGQAQVQGGAVVGIRIINPGTGYTQLPLITVGPSPAGPPGQATAVVADTFTIPGSTWTLLPADPFGPSYPVYVDPMGYCTTAGLPYHYWLGGSFAVNTIARRTASYTLAGAPLAPNNNLTMRWTCLLEDIPFATESTPNAPNSPTGGPYYDVEPNPAAGFPGSFTRDIRYCCAYMLKRPRTSDSSVVDMSVVVYNNNRPILSSSFNEYLYQTTPDGRISEVSFNASATTSSITIDVTATGNVVPPARPGDWLLDASYVPNQAQTFASVNGYFYRVVGVTQNTETNYTFEVLQPLRNMPATTAVNPATNAPFAWQKVIFLEGVAEVYEKGPGRLP